MSQRDKKETIAYYEEGTERQKRLARRWQKMLKEEFYDKKNRIGRQGLYLVLKLRENSVQDKYPTKRFVGAWLKRQNTNQINRKPPRRAPSIQAVILSKWTICISTETSPGHPSPTTTTTTLKNQFNGEFE